MVRKGSSLGRLKSVTPCKPPRRPEVQAFQSSAQRHVGAGVSRCSLRRHLTCLRAGQGWQRRISLPPPLSLIPVFSFAGSAIESPPFAERYRSGHNGTDSKSVEGITSLRGFESLPLRQK